MANKKTILIVMGGMSANFASFTLGKALANKGYRIIYLSEGHQREYIEKQGFEYHTFYLPDAEIGLNSKEQRSSLLRKFNRCRAMCRQWIIERDYMSSCAEKWLDETKPALVLLDHTLPRFAIPALRKKIPIINLNLTLASFYFKGRPPVFSPVFPAMSYAILSKIWIELAWAKIFFWQLWLERVFRVKARFGFGFSGFETVKSQIKKEGAQLKRTEYGLCLLAPEIVLSPKFLDFPGPEQRENRRYAGICVDEERKDYDFSYDNLDQKRPLIFCGMGTNAAKYKHAGRLYRCLFECMAQLPQYQCVLQADGLEGTDLVQGKPDNVSIHRRIHTLGLLKRAVLFINHGGFGSVREAVMYGVPMIVFPGWRDQIGNAARVAYHGIGLRGNMKKLTTPLLMSMIQNALDSDRIKDSIRRMQEMAKDKTDFESAIEYIESYIHDHNA